MRDLFWPKIKEALVSVIPITIIVILLHYIIAPMPNGTFALFLTGAFLLILGMGFFTLGADIAMMPMGESIGSKLTQSKNLWFIILTCFALGVFITIAEPDLQVLAEQVVGISNGIIIMSVALGVGFFLVVALLRMVLRIPLRYMLIGFYIIVFSLGFFVPDDFIAIAFDSGGVTTGPITVPFIMALGIGLTAVLGGKSSHDDSFGLIALCSIGPILAVMIMGIVVDVEGTSDVMQVTDPQTINELLAVYGHNFPEYAKEVAIALSPIVVIFALFQIFTLRLPKGKLIQMCMGLIYTYIGLVLFLTGVNVGFMPAGNYLGSALANLDYHYILIPLGFIMGCFIVLAEPAVHVLNKQVEEITGGSISRKAMMISLAAGVGISLALAMCRVLTGLSIWYLIIPGYGIALLLSFFVPKIFTAVAFDSGGVASGPMTATFLLPFSLGACSAIGGNLFTDAFGIVTMVAMTPLITIQILGVLYTIKERSKAKLETASAGSLAATEETELEFEVETTDDDISDDMLIIVTDETNQTEKVSSPDNDSLLQNLEEGTPLQTEKEGKTGTQTEEKNKVIEEKITGDSIDKEKKEAETNE